MSRNPRAGMQTDTLRGRKSILRNKNERKQTLLCQVWEQTCDTAVSLCADRGTACEIGDDNAEGRMQGLWGRSISTSHMHTALYIQVKTACA